MLPMLYHRGVTHWEHFLCSALSAGKAIPCPYPSRTDASRLNSACCQRKGLRKRMQLLRSFLSPLQTTEQDMLPINHRFGHVSFSFDVRPAICDLRRLCAKIISRPLFIPAFSLRRRSECRFFVFEKQDLPRDTDRNIPNVPALGRSLLHPAFPPPCRPPSKKIFFLRKDAGHDILASRPAALQKKRFITA